MDTTYLDVWQWAGAMTGKHHEYFGMGRNQCQRTNKTDGPTNTVNTELAIELSKGKLQEGTIKHEQHDNTVRNNQETPCVVQWYTETNCLLTMLLTD